MAQVDMYDAQVNSPQVTLSASIDSVQTTIPISGITSLPTAPNVVTIGFGQSSPETILYTTRDDSNNQLTGVTRGFEGTAQSWDGGTAVARVLTAYDINSVQDNINEIDATITNHKDNTSNPHSVNASDVGLGNVENVALSTADWADIGIATTDVSAGDVGLDNVENKALSTISWSDLGVSKYTDSEAVNAVANADDYVKNTGDTINGDIDLSDNDLQNVRYIDSANGSHRFKFDSSTSWVELTDQSNNRHKLVTADVYIDDGGIGWLSDLDTGGGGGQVAVGSLVVTSEGQTDTDNFGFTADAVFANYDHGLDYSWTETNVSSISITGTTNVPSKQADYIAIKL